MPDGVVLSGGEGFEDDGGRDVAVSGKLRCGRS
jgi:hypothetical protein